MWTTTPLNAIAAPPMTTINVQKIRERTASDVVAPLMAVGAAPAAGLPLAHEQRDQRHADAEDNGTQDQARGAPAGSSGSTRQPRAGAPSSRPRRRR